MIDVILAAQAARESRNFVDRRHTVGASEVGQCQRRVWYGKHDTPRDGGRPDSWGPAARGTLIEQHLLVPAMLEQFQDRFILGGEEQQTFFADELSATPDGMLVDLQPADRVALGLPESATSVVVEFKTVDPRTRLDEPKSAHVLQVQTQLGLLRERTNHKPEHGLLVYVDASDLSTREFTVAFDPAIFVTAKQRARKIMRAAAAAELIPEGYIAGGRECEFCPFRGPCGVARTSMPASDNTNTIDPVAAAEVVGLGRELMRLDAVADAAACEARACKEDIRSRLRELGVRRVHGDGLAVVWSSVKGRTSLDHDAMRHAGIDLTKFEKEGAPSDRLSVKPMSA